MSKKEDKFFNLNQWNNPFEDKIENFEKKLDDVIRTMKENDESKYGMFLGSKYFKFKK